MLPLRRIICPTDFSDPSYRALDVAAELATHFEAELLVVHVVRAIPVAPAATPIRSPASSAQADFDVSAYQEVVLERARLDLDDAIASRLSGQSNVRPIVIHGRPANAITDLAEKEHPDLLVIATHGRTGVKRFLFGSVAEKVVRTAPCPVLTIQPPDDD